MFRRRNTVFCSVSNSTGNMKNIVSECATLNGSFTVLKDEKRKNVNNKNTRSYNFIQSDIRCTTSVPIILFRLFIASHMRNPAGIVLSVYFFLYLINHLLPPSKTRCVLCHSQIFFSCLHTTCFGNFHINSEGSRN